MLRRLGKRSVGNVSTLLQTNVATQLTTPSLLTDLVSFPASFAHDGSSKSILITNPPSRCVSTGHFLTNRQSSSHPSVLERVLPTAIVPYAQLMRLDKFSATWLLAWPCFWSIGLAAPLGSFPDLPLMALFGAGSIVMRSAGCIVNDLWDIEFDKKVQRTKERPLPSKRLTVPQSFSTVCLAAHGVTALTILLQLNNSSVILGLLSVPLVCSYPLMKRFTYWPQLFLGLTINWGALMGWTAVKGTCDWSVTLPLYASGILWTLIYDTIYACQDKADDQLIGVKSTALLFGDNLKAWLSGFAFCQVGSLVLTGMMMNGGPVYYCSVLATGGHLMWQIISLDARSSSDCMKKFVSNKWLGPILFVGIIADKFVL